MVSLDLQVVVSSVVVLCRRLYCLWRHTEPDKDSQDLLEEIDSVGYVSVLPQMQPANIEIKKV